MTSKNKIQSAELPPIPGLDAKSQASTKKRVLLRAPTMTQSGYGVHSRQIARWLFAQEDARDDLEVTCEPLVWGKTPWLLDASAQNGLIGRVIQSAQNQHEHYDVSIQLQLPNEWNPMAADYNIGVTAAVETDRCNPEWVKCVNQMDMVIVPSEHVKNNIEAAGEVTTKLLVVPESFTDACKDGALDISQNGTLDEITDLSDVPTDFNFLVFGQFCGDNPDNDRKNLAYTIKWLCEEFKNNEDVGVLVKTNFGRNTKHDRQNTAQVLSKVLMEVKQGVGPKFYLLHGDMSDEEVAALYRHSKTKALVALTRGEGFGLPILEAAACGLPVITTDWSAHTEFLKQGKYIKVDYKLAPVHQSRVDGAIFQEGMKWAHPVEQDAKRKLRRFYKSPGLPTEWAKDLSDKLQETHSFEAICRKYDEVLKDIV